MLHNLPMLALPAFFMVLAFASTTGLLLQSEVGDMPWSNLCNLSKSQNQLEAQLNKECFLDTGLDIEKFKYNNSVIKPHNGSFSFVNVFWVLHEQGERGPDCADLHHLHANVSVQNEFRKQNETKTMFGAEALCASLRLREF